MLFAAAARIVKLDAGVVADGGEVAAVEEGAGVGELRDARGRRGSRG